MQGIAGYITSPYAVWFPFALAGAAAVIGIIAMIYMLSTFTGRQDLRVWARVKIYEVLMAIVLILVFFAIVALLTSLNFEQIFASAGLVPAACGPPLNKATDFFTLSVCDMHQFNQDVSDLAGAVYYLGVASSMVPQIDVQVGLPIVGSLKSSFNPIQPGFSSFLGYLVDIIFAAYVLSQVQLLLLAAALLLFSLFLGIGLIARIFAVTRSFGGAMIALGVGLGIVYPILICLTYGYVNVGLDAISTSVGGIFVNLAGGISEALRVMLGGFLSSSVPAASQTLLVALLTYGGLVGAGLIFVPFLNLIIVDVFVIDFSQAIGERMDFLRLFTALV